MLFHGSHCLIVLYELLDVAGVTFILEEMMCSVCEYLIREIAHSVHGILVCRIAFCCIKQVLVINLHVEFLENIATHELPFEIFCEAVKLFIDILFGDFLFIILQKPSFQEGLRKRNASFVDIIFTNILIQLVIRILLMVVLKPLGYPDI